MKKRTEKEIMRNWYEEKNDNPLVSIKCMVYNQENYITQTIEGFLIQETTFPFEILIHDDASTDGTIEIIQSYAKQYPNLIKPIYEEENCYSKNDRSHHTKIDAACKGKYVAMCEGDDYWIDKKKLQMQVDFLEQNPDFGMSYTKAKIYFQDKKQFGKVIGDKKCSFDELIQNNSIGTLTVCYRKELYLQYLEEVDPASKNWNAGDYPIWLWIAQHSKIQFINKVTAVYRILKESASHSTNIEKFIDTFHSDDDIRSYFLEKKGISFNSFFDSHFARGEYHLSKGERKKATEEFLLAKKNKKQQLYLLVSRNSFCYFLFIIARACKRGARKYGILR